MKSMTSATTGMRRPSCLRGTGALFAVVLMLGVTVACSSDSKTTASSTGSSSTSATGSSAADPVSAAKDRLQTFLAAPSKIRVSTPLTRKPDTGKKVFWLEGNAAQIQEFTPGFKDGAAALGWNLTTLTYDVTDPQAVGAAMQQAIDQNADFIVVSGQPEALYSQQLASAKAKGIPVFDQSSANKPDPTGNGRFTNVAGPESTAEWLNAVADYTIVDSGGKANVLFANLADFPVSQEAGAIMLDHFKSSCPGCTVTTINVPTSDLVAGNVPSLVVSAAQQHPGLQYVITMGGAIALGIQPALAAANFNDVQICGLAPEKDQVQDLVNGVKGAWAMFQTPMMSLVNIDAMARLSVGMPIEQSEHDQIPFQIWDSDNVPKPAQAFASPADALDQFKTIWKVK